MLAAIEGLGHGAVGTRTGLRARPGAQPPGVDRPAPARPADSSYGTLEQGGGQTAGRLRAERARSTTWPGVGRRAGGPAGAPAGPPAVGGWRAGSPERHRG